MNLRISLVWANCKFAVKSCAFSGIIATVLKIFYETLFLDWDQNFTNVRSVNGPDVIIHKGHRGTCIHHVHMNLLGCEYECLVN